MKKNTIKMNQTDDENNRAFEKMMISHILNKKEITYSDLEMINNFSEESQQELGRSVTLDIVVNLMRRLALEIRNGSHTKDRIENQK